MADIEEILAGARMPERTIPLCLRGDLQAEFEDLERQLRKAELDADDSLAAGSEARAIAELIEAVRQQMAEHTQVFRVRGIDSEAYSDLLAKHKPTDEQRREGYDLNMVTFPAELVAACAVDPAMTLEQAQRLSRAISHRQWEDLFNAALACNRQAVEVPFSLAASAIRAASAPSSTRPERGASPGADSSAGSLAE